MSADFGILCGEILKQIFGETAQKIGEWLFGVNSASLQSIAKATNVKRNEVIEVLRVLLKFNLVQVKPSVSSAPSPEYALKRDEVYYLLRFGRYMQIVRKKLDGAAANVLEQILYEGSLQASNILLNCMRSANNKYNLEQYRNGFLQLLQQHYIIRKPYRTTSKATEVGEAVPELHLDEGEEFAQPPLNLALLAQILTGKVTAEHADDKDIFWLVNYAQFHQDLRDELIISVYKRKINEKAALVVSHILELVNEHSMPWFRKYSNTFTLADLKQKIDRKGKELPADVVKYLDQYVTVIAEDSLGFLRKVGDRGGGEYTFDMAIGFENLAYECVQNVIQERFHSNGTRIFRVVRLKHYIDQEDLQKEVMIAAKDVKLMTYSLFQEQFLHLKVIRKAGGGAAGPARTFNLYTIKLLPIVKMLLDMCYKTLYNILAREYFINEENMGIVEKAEKLDCIVAAMRQRGETEAYIEEICETVTPPEREILDRAQRSLTTLSKVVLLMRDNIFLLQMYMYHSAYNTKHTATPTATT